MCFIQIPHGAWEAVHATLNLGQRPLQLDRLSTHLYALSIIYTEVSRLQQFHWASLKHEISPGACGLLKGRNNRNRDARKLHHAVYVLGRCKRIQPNEQNTQAVRSLVLTASLSVNIQKGKPSLLLDAGSTPEE